MIQKHRKPRCAHPFYALTISQCLDETGSKVHPVLLGNMENLSSEHTQTSPTSKWLLEYMSEIEYDRIIIIKKPSIK